jgi:penicillin amidase
MNLPPAFPAERHVTYDWYSPHRRHRIDEVLGGAAGVTASDLVALHSDFVSPPARRIMARVALLPVPRELDGLALLLDWDADLRADSAAAALFEVWYRRHLRPALLGAALAPLVGADRVAAALGRLIRVEDASADARVDLELLEQPGTRLGPDPERTLADLVVATLPAAVGELTALLGPDRSEWRWGRLHVAMATHPLRALLTGVPEEHLMTGPAPRGGSGETVGNTAYDANFRQTSGATFRIVVDVGDWDSSLVMNMPGQSGRLGDPHTTDLFEPWARGEAFPLAYSRERVDEVAEQVIELRPAPAEDC